ncbi:hypothetical protein HPB51_019003 [Rhipicephalus microplus]|uniref:Tick transposon n=1 Tax=Rhipicephalus microplus TaxID=6941 RepID=A0A9J6D6H9_RHIMP|nr:hypothetical protein HPB51_019003 [Rhipicephalus microplus]
MLLATAAVRQLSHWRSSPWPVHSQVPSGAELVSSRPTSESGVSLGTARHRSAILDSASNSPGTWILGHPGPHPAPWSSVHTPASRLAERLARLSSELHALARTLRARLVPPVPPVSPRSSSLSLSARLEKVLPHNHFSAFRAAVEKKNEKQKRPGGYEAGSRLISAFPACRWRRPTPKHVTCPQNAYRFARLSYVLRIFRSTMSPRGKYRTLPLKEKLAAIQEVDAGVKKTEVALKYGITKSTLTTILKAKDKLQNNASRFAPDRKRLREAAYPDLENAVLLWLKRARSSNLPINGPILREKAEELSLRLGIEDFKCSDGWISRFKERHALSFKTTEGDDESQVLSALKAHNIAADLDSYAATDDNLCVCREDTLDDLVAEVLPAQHSSESEEEPEVENVTTAQAFQYIAKSRIYENF